jgi:hypothetical protein
VKTTPDIHDPALRAAIFLQIKSIEGVFGEGGLLDGDGEVLYYNGNLVKATFKRGYITSVVKSAFLIILK